jgi:hypothetical protein
MNVARTAPLPISLATVLAVAFSALPRPCFAELFTFDTAELQSVPVGWFMSMTHDGGAPRWQIEHDPTSRSGARVLAQLSTDPTPQRFPLAILAAPSVTDGKIDVRFKPVAGQMDQAAGIVWRYRDENNYYLVRANALENNVVAYKVEDGERTALAPVGHEGQYGVRHTVPTGSWSLLGVAFEGSRFTVYFDGEELFQVEDSTFSGAGTVGVWTKADSVTYFDDFELRSSRQPARTL